MREARKANMRRIVAQVLALGEARRSNSRATASLIARGAPPKLTYPKPDIETLPQVFMAADDAGGCDGRAADREEVAATPAPVKPDVPKGAAEEVRHPLNARQPRINLASAPSGMEKAAASWQAGGSSASKAMPFVGKDGEGKAFCKCGGRGVKDGGFVPAWFGRDCIEKNCPLRAEQETA